MTDLQKEGHLLEECFVHQRQILKEKSTKSLVLSRAPFQFHKKPKSITKGDVD